MANCVRLESCNFVLVKLNFLEISEAGLQNVPGTLASLVNLTSLVLKSNQLSNVPDGINRYNCRNRHLKVA